MLTTEPFKLEPDTPETGIPTDPQAQNAMLNAVQGQPQGQPRGQTFDPNNPSTPKPEPTKSPAEALFEEAVRKVVNDMDLRILR